MHILAAVAVSVLFSKILSTSTIHLHTKSQKYFSLLAYYIEKVIVTNDSNKSWNNNQAKYL